MRSAIMFGLIVIGLFFAFSAVAGPVAVPIENLMQQRNISGSGALGDTVISYNVKFFRDISTITSRKTEPVIRQTFTLVNSNFKAFVRARTNLDGVASFTMSLKDSG